jgi:hypothetical protein
VKTGQKPVSVVQVNYAFDKGLTDPDELLDRYFTLTGWSEALRGAGAGSVAVVQRFHRDVRVARNGIDANDHSAIMLIDRGGTPRASNETCEILA